jgi:hypothetical protein
MPVCLRTSDDLRARLARRKEDRRTRLASLHLYEEEGEWAVEECEEELTTVDGVVEEYKRKYSQSLGLCVEQDEAEGAGEEGRGPRHGEALEDLRQIG